MVSKSVIDLSKEELNDLMYGLVIPRPIAWVSTLSKENVANLAPFSFFNIISVHPPVIMFAVTLSSKTNPQGHKDTLINIIETKEFVVNFVSVDFFGAMVRTGSPLEPHIDEFEYASLKKIGSDKISVPRVAGARASLECRLNRKFAIGDAVAIFGNVVQIHVDNMVLSDGKPIAERLQPISRLGGPYYSCLGHIMLPHKQDR